MRDPPGTSTARVEFLEPGLYIDFLRDALTTDFFLRDGCDDSGMLAMTSRAPRSLSIGARAVSFSDGATFACTDNDGFEK
jgi:hypothetical protein